jgi:hypothetical protein
MLQRVSTTITLHSAVPPGVDLEHNLVRLANGCWKVSAPIVAENNAARRQKGEVEEVAVKMGEGDQVWGETASTARMRLM